MTSASIGVSSSRMKTVCPSSAACASHVMRVSLPPYTSLPVSPFGRAVHFAVSSAYATDDKLLMPIMTTRIAVKNRSATLSVRVRFIPYPIV